MKAKEIRKGKKPQNTFSKLRGLMKQWNVWCLRHFSSNLGVKLYILKKIQSITIHSTSSAQQCRSHTANTSPQRPAYRAGSLQSGESSRSPRWDSKSAAGLAAPTCETSLPFSDWYLPWQPRSSTRWICQQTGKRVLRGGDDSSRSCLWTTDLLPWGEKNKLTCKL